jgi:hypothetical protein
VNLVLLESLELLKLLELLALQRFLEPLVVV